MGEDRDEGGAPRAETSAAAWSALHAASRRAADEFLAEQIKLAQKQGVIADLQIEELRREDSLRHWSLRVRHISDVMKLAFEFAVAAIVVAVAAFIGGAIWSAVDDKSVIVESFSVPPDLAARGLTGEVIATKVLDKLASLQSQTTSSRAPSSYANNWGDGIKVQIPDTGVSIGEFSRFLHQWLGHQTRISGEIYRTPAGIAVSARAGNSSTPTFSGTEADIDNLAQQAAEAIYRNTQPYRYAVYLEDHNRQAEATSLFESLIKSGTSQDQAWAYIGLSGLFANRGDFEGAIVLLRRSFAADPDNAIAHGDLQNDEGALQHDEAELAEQHVTVALTERSQESGVNPADVPVLLLEAKVNLAQELNDDQAVLALDRELETTPDFNSSVEFAHNSDLSACADSHDADCVEVAKGEYLPTKEPARLLNRHFNAFAANGLMGHWRAVLAEAPSFDADFAKVGPLARALKEVFVVRAERPLVALAYANLGEFKPAHAAIDETPADCVFCLRARGRVDTLEKNWGGAEYWFERAASAAPSIPLVYSDWGAMLLAKGDYSGAIEKFRLANARGPHFADPLVMWGEALIAENRSDLAVSKFGQAANYAPNWGRLHLNLAKALFYAGSADDAKKQIEVASKLDLSDAERGELAWLMLQLKDRH